MPEQITRDGMNFWAFPNLPFDIGERMKALLDFYLRTDPVTNVVDLKQWAVYPNNATPRNLLPLIEFLQTLTQKNADTIDIGWSDWDPKAVENNRWRERLDFYAAVVQGLYAEQPDVSVGDPTNSASLELATSVVEPLFLGWYPNNQEPFSTMPGPYGQQETRAVMDLYFPFAMANEIKVENKFQNEAWTRLKTNLLESARKVLTEYIPVIPVFKFLLGAVAVGLVIGVATRTKG